MLIGLSPHFSKNIMQNMKNKRKLLSDKNVIHWQRRRRQLKKRKVFQVFDEILNNTTTDSRSVSSEIKH